MARVFEDDKRSLVFLCSINMVLSILAVGTDSDHMIRHIKYCDAQNDENIVIDVLLTRINISGSVFQRDSGVFCVRMPTLFNLFLHLPYIGDFIRNYLPVVVFKKLIGKNSYSLICIHQLHPYTLSMTRIAKKKGLKVALVPWGSDVLRATPQKQKNLKKAFSLADYSISDHGNGIDFTNKYSRMYDVPSSKLVDAAYGSEVISSIYKQKEYLKKSSIADEFGIPHNRVYITCGYAATRAQRHLEMIEAIGKSRNEFSQKPFLIFPFSYGPDRMNDYPLELTELCSKYNLDYCFITDYLSVDKVARLRLLSDMYFHILPTDAASASLVEYIFAGSACIIGAWLEYPVLKRFKIKYYPCKSLSDLPDLVRSIITSTNDFKILLAKETEVGLLSSGSEVKIKKWYTFYHKLLHSLDV